LSGHKDHPAQEASDAKKLGHPDRRRLANLIAGLFIV
jgi:hypothetical protein